MPEFTEGPQRHSLCSRFQFVVFAGVGLGLQDGQKWKSTRKLLTPAFHFKTIKPYIDVFEESAKVLLVRQSNFNI